MRGLVAAALLRTMDGPASVRALRARHSPLKRVLGRLSRGSSSCRIKTGRSAQHNHGVMARDAVGLAGRAGNRWSGDGAAEAGREWTRE